MVAGLQMLWSCAELSHCGCWFITDLGQSGLNVFADFLLYCVPASICYCVCVDFKCRFAYVMCNMHVLLFAVKGVLLSFQFQTAEESSSSNYVCFYFGLCFEAEIVFRGEKA